MWVVHDPYFSKREIPVYPYLDDVGRTGPILLHRKKKSPGALSFSQFINNGGCLCSRIWAQFKIAKLEENG